MRSRFVLLIVATLKEILVQGRLVKVAMLVAFYKELFARILAVVFSFSYLALQ